MQKTIKARILFVFITFALAAVACNLPVGTATPPDAPVEPTTGAEVSEVNIYMIALEDNGQSGEIVGCGDSLIEVRRAVAPTSQPVRAALDTLLAQKDQYYGESGLYNALYQSNLAVQTIQVGSDGIATVELTGQVVLGGTCDSPRVKAQIVQTILDAGGYDWVEVFINGDSIDEVLSQQ